MKYALVTGSGGLIGSEAVKFLIEKNYFVVGIDNDMRKYFFGEEASTKWNVEKLKDRHMGSYEHYTVDIRDDDSLDRIFKKYEFDIIIHSAAQPSHDWAAKEPIVDFDVNARATVLILEKYRKYSPKATFIYTSTNKVYGDNPNFLPLVELEKRYEISTDHAYSKGIDELMSLDYTTHSVFGASKASADIMVQEYGRYFGLNTGVFRGGCLTGPAHSGAQLHGFLSYLVKSILTNKKYTIFGYKGKQVRDNIHAHDLIEMFWHFHENPRKGEVYNVGGGSFSNVSMLEAIEKIEKISGKKANIEYVDKARVGDHIWYVSDLSKFKSHYPNWVQKYNIDDILTEMIEMYNRKDKKVAFVCPFNIDRLTGTPIRTKVTINSVKQFSNIRIIATSGASDEVESVGQVGIGKFIYRSVGALRKYSPDIMHGVSTLSVIPMFIYKCLFNWKAKVVFEIHGWSWFELKGKASLIKRLVFLLVDIIGYRFSTAVISMSFSQRNYLYKEFGYRDRVSVVWGPAGFDFNHELNKNDYNKKEINIGYIGNDSFWQGLDTVLDAAKKLESQQGITFELAGFDYSNEGKFPKLKNVKYVGRVERDKVPDFIRKMDIMISPRINGAVSNLQYPQKLSEYLGCGRPVIVSNVSDQKMIIDKHKCGYVLESIDGKSIADNIRKFLALPTEDKVKMSESATKFAEKELSAGVYDEKLRHIYTTI